MARRIGEAMDCSNRPAADLHRHALADALYGAEGVDQTALLHAREGAQGHEIADRPLGLEVFELLAENKLATGGNASPAVIGNAFIHRTRTHLYRLEAK